MRLWRRALKKAGAWKPLPGNRKPLPGTPEPSLPSQVARLPSLLPPGSTGATHMKGPGGFQIQD